MQTLKALVLVVAPLLGLWAGGAGCDTVDAVFDCQAVCSRYRDCFDASYDVDKCRSQCRTASANDPDVRQKADACEACIGPRSCLSATFVCGTECAAIVP
jgi:hypothetical protein